MNEERIAEFLQWLPSRFEEFQNMSLDEIAQTVNQLYETEEGKQTIETLWNTFNSEFQPEQTVFKKGGKLDQLVQLHKKGGKVKTCSCGCTMHKVFKDGGVIDKCACGCKVEKKQDGGQLPVDNSRGQRIGRFAAHNNRFNKRPEPSYGDRPERSWSAEYATPNNVVNQVLNKGMGTGNKITERQIRPLPNGGRDTLYKRPGDSQFFNKTQNPSEYNRLNTAFSQFFPQGQNNFLLQKKNKLK